MNFESTLPFGEPELMRVSAFRRYLDDLDRDSDAEHVSRCRRSARRCWHDLMRFEQDGDGGSLELLEVLAACCATRAASRSTCSATTRSCRSPCSRIERLCHCPLPMREFLDRRLVRAAGAARGAGGAAPARRRANAAWSARRTCTIRWRRWLWQLALRGSRDALLPEIAGAAAYRVAPGVNLATCR